MTFRSRLWAIFTLVVLVAAVGFYARHVLRTFGGATIDDAAISYAYAHNIAHGHGARLSPAASPVEGFSNPLEVLSLVPCAWLGADVDAAAKILNVGWVALGLLAWGLFLWRHLRGGARLMATLPALITLMWPAFNYWTTAGLEGGMMAGLQMLAVLALLGRGRGSDIGLGTSAGLLAWTRPEGVVYGAIAVLVGLRSRRWRALLVFIGLCVLLLGLRFVIFHDVVANTYWAKVGRPDRFVRGLKYVGGFLVNQGGCLLFLLPILIPLVPRLRPAARAAAAQLAFAFLFPIVVGGDWMKYWRFLQSAQGPLTALMALGTYAAFAPETKALGAAVLTRWGLVLGLIVPGLLLAAPWSQLSEQERTMNGRRDLDMRKIAVCAERYRSLGEALHLGRPLLAADVDVGGLAYPPGLEVLDLGGLGDRVLGHSGTRQPAVVADYLFGERRPDTIHLHGGWLELRPLHLMSPFARQYRVMGERFLQHMAMAPLTAVRADLIDPPAAPVLAIGVSIDDIRVEGVSAYVENGNTVLFVHATQTSANPPPRLWWAGADGHRMMLDWHLGYDVNPGPPGSALVGYTIVGDVKLPLRLDHPVLELATLPTFSARSDDAASLSRLPLLRVLNFAAPDCAPDAVLDADAPSADRARGLAWLAQLCGPGLSPQARGREAERLWQQAQQLGDANHRYDTAAVLSALAVPMTLQQRLFIERARAQHVPYDETAQAWAAAELADSAPEPEAIRAGLSLLIAARDYAAVMQTALARGWAHVPEAAPALCAASRALALCPGVVAVDCPAAEPRVKIVRQDFEDPADPTLHLTGAAARWLDAAAHGVAGGRGRLRVATHGAGEIIWGPFPCPGERFAALVGGRGPGRVVLEARDGQAWSELARLKPTAATVLQPQLIALSPGEHRDVRVRVIDLSDEGGLVVDDVVFFGGEDLE